MRSICLIPVLLAFSTGVAAAAPGDTHMVISAATLRSAPGGMEIGTVTSRDPAPLIERSRQGGWIETDRGWVWGQLICPTSAAAAAGTTGEPRPDEAAATSCPVPSGGTPTASTFTSTSIPSNRMQIAVYASDLRRSPKSDAPSDFRLGRGTEVVTSRADGDWVRISLGDASGWVLRSHLKPVEAASAATAVSAPAVVAEPDVVAPIGAGAPTSILSKPRAAKRTTDSAVTLAGY